MTMVDLPPSNINDKNVLPLNKKARTEIQYLRALAVTGVLLFHLFPKLAPQGFLGVDVFFVISGYLMAMLVGSKPLNSSLVLNFYERRLKRLLPAYLLVVTATLLLCSFVLIQANFDLVAIDARYALAFATNLQPLLEKQEYFQLVSEHKFFLHTWSLAVEVQFYVIAPFCLAIITKMGSKARLLCILIILISATFQNASYFSPAVSFGLLPSRIWQFFVGVLVYHSESLSNGFGCVYRVSGFVLLSLILFVPSKALLSEQVQRFFATVVTGVVIFNGPISTPLKPIIARIHQSVLYVGDISYSLYLVHWPLEILCRYEAPSFNRVILLGGIIVISVVQYELFESKLLKATRERIFFICSLLFIFALMQSFLSGGIATFFKDKQLLAEMNSKMFDCKYHFECPEDPEMKKYFSKIDPKQEHFMCKFKGTGNYSIFVAGNSFATRQFDGVFEALRGRYSKLYYYGRNACTFFDDVNAKWNANHCKDMVGKTAAFMKEIQPDIVIFIASLNYAMKTPAAASYEAVKNETIVQKMQTFVRQSLEPYTKRIIHVLPHGTAPFNPALEIAKKYENKEKIDNLTIPFEPYAADVRFSTWRQVAAFENCSKCRAIDSMQVFCSNQTQTCELYDKVSGMSLFCNENHVSIYGAKKLVPFYDDAITRALADLDGS